MSLVAYGSSDESENEEEINEGPQEKTETPNVQKEDVNNCAIPQSSASKTEQTDKVNGEQKTLNQLPQGLNKNIKLQLPAAKTNGVKESNVDDNIEDSDEDEDKPNFNKLPQPKSHEINDLVETDNTAIFKKVNYANIEKPPKKQKGPTKITIPSLSDFQDLDEEENTSRKNVIKPSKKGSGLIGMLPPPKSSVISTKTTTMVPHVLTKKPVETKTMIPQSVKKIQKPVSQTKTSTTTMKYLSNYNSDSEEEDAASSNGTDFFSLLAPSKIPDEQLMPISIPDINESTPSSSISKNTEGNSLQEENESNKTLVSNIMNLPREEILAKNKAEVGPKLPVPEQEYHVDSEGNVAFDEKAIEYLCGKRGVKRKNEFSNVDIVEISGDDIKPDEREWLVKALTEEPIHRPISAGSGPGGQSKKKHQITYLAHQAKAMELELKNQWAQNKASRQQTRSKYGF